MDDALFVEVQQGLDGLFEVVAGFDLSEKFVLSEFIEEGAVSVLQEQVQAVLFFEALVQFKAVGVPQEGLDFYLPDQSLYYLWAHFLQ